MKLTNFFFIFQVIAFELVTVNSPYYYGILTVGSQHVNLKLRSNIKTFGK